MFVGMHKMSILVLCGYKIGLVSPRLCVNKMSWEVGVAMQTIQIQWYPPPTTLQKKFGSIYTHW